MSELRIGLVVEGVTDAIVIEAGLKRLLKCPFILTSLQPDTPPGVQGEGWGGIYRWCRQVGAVPGNTLLESPLLQNFDLLILAIDADVASKTYSSANIQDPLSDDLPCEQACPPASDTTEKLEAVVEHWLSPVQIDTRTVLCIPSKSIESWVAAALYAESDSGFPDMIECFYDILQYMHAKPARERLVSSKDGRLRKRKKQYKLAQRALVERWDTVEKFCTQALKFRASLEGCVEQIL
ncbi:hypothetical protein ACTVJH_09530 [Desulfoplanes sp. PS50]|jgi:hypothetical protein